MAKKAEVLMQCFNQTFSYLLAKNGGLKVTELLIYDYRFKKKEKKKGKDLCNVSNPWLLCPKCKLLLGLGLGPVPAFSLFAGTTLSSCTPA